MRKGRENYLCLLNLEDAVQGGFANRAQVFAQLAARWRTWLQSACADYADWRVPRSQPGTLNYPECVLHLDEVLPQDAIITNGAGNFATPVHRFYRHRGHKTQLAPTSGAMGYAVPSAIAAMTALTWL